MNLWNPSQRLAAAVLAVAALMLASACRQTASVAPPPPPTVTVNQPLEHEVTRWDQYSGYLSSPKTVTVNARVSGLIEEAPFREGTIVHAGDLLFKIDSRPFKADRDNKAAAVAQARASAAKAKADFARSSALIRSRVIAQADYDATKAAYGEAEGSLQAAIAALESADLNLQWTEVRAPITGRISRINVTVGNLVNGGSGQVTPLTTIVSIDPLYCYITVPETAALRYRELALQGPGEASDGPIPCWLKLESDQTFDRHGVIDFIDNQVDVNTGTVQLRGVFPNPRGLLMPGLFAVMRVPASTEYRALLIPDAAVNTDQDERYLLIVGNDHVVQRRTVKLGALFGTLRDVTGGLRPGEWVVVDGTQLAIPGARVNPRQALIAQASIQALDQMAAWAQPSESSATGAASRVLSEGDSQAGQ
jgi:RND family efflux transporter MFP subunit